MKRRNFLKNGLAATGTAALATASFIEANAYIQANNQGKHNFKLKYAPHFGMFKNSAGDDLIDQLQFMADTGFTSFEDNGMLKRSVEDQTKVGEKLAKLGMTMGVFVVDGGDNWKISLTTGEKDFVDTFVKTCHQSVEVAKRVNATWMTVVPGYFERKLPIGIQTANVIEALKRGAAVFEPHGLVMVLEPLSDNPDLFLRTPEQSFMVCKSVDSPSCKTLFDIYHMQRNVGDLIVNIDRCWDEIAYIQIGDNPGRKEPTTGEINYKNIFKHLYEKNYQGVLGMEHGISQPGKAGEERLIRAYAEVDDFS